MGLETSGMAPIPPIISRYKVDIQIVITLARSRFEFDNDPLVLYLGRD